MVEMMKEALLLYNGWHRGDDDEADTLWYGSQSMVGVACVMVRRWRKSRSKKARPSWRRGANSDRTLIAYVIKPCG